MNERIKRLRKEAWAFVTHDLETVERDHVVTYAEHLEMHYAKFAELIIQECSEHIAHNQNINWLTAANAAKELKKHFGVKE